MNPARWILTSALLAAAMAGCSAKHESPQAAAQELQKSFQSADPVTTQAVVQAANALQAHDYAQAVIIMDRAVQGQTLDEARKKAVDALLIQTRRAIEQDPKLNNAQLYDAMSSLLVRVHGEN